MSKDEYKLITDYTVTDYKCGLRAGDTVTLIKDLQITDHRGRPVEVIRAGGEWIILNGAIEDPDVVWLHQPDGERHTWDDTPEIFEWFRVVSRSDEKAEEKCK